MYQASNLIDFHNHHVPARFELTALRAAPANQRARWEAMAKKLADEQLLLKDIENREIGARVVNIPAQLIAEPDGSIAHDTIVAMNDHLAELVARRHGRLYGLASVDPYDGDRSAREAERAIRALKLRGLIVDCGRGELLIDAPQARPTLEVAAKLGVPVLIHPIAAEPQTRQMTPYGVVGTLFARGTVNGAALIALVEGGVFQELPGLRVVVTAMAIGGLALLVGLGNQSRVQGGPLDLLRKHVFIDTTCCHPTILRASVDLLGASNVIAGSDWPVNGGPFRELLEKTMRAAGLNDSECEAIARGNALRQLGVA